MNQNLTIGRPLVILTGGIATGKSSVAQRLRQHGIDVIDTDAIAPLPQMARLIGQPFAISSLAIPTRKPGWSKFSTR